MIQSNLIINSNTYTIVKVIDEGKEGIVYQAINNQTQEIVAIKQYKQQTSHLNEFSFINKLNHNNLMQLKDGSSQAIITLQNDDVHYISCIVSSFASKGCLLDLVNQFKLQLDEQVAQSFFSQLVNGLSYLHDQGYAHLDLKLENLLLDENFNLQICDYGTLQDLKGKKGDYLLKSFQGTMQFVAPEIYENIPYSGIKADVFSCGVILFLLIFKQYPFYHATRDDEIYNLIYNQRLDLFWMRNQELIQNSPFKINFELLELISRMIMYDPNQRPTIQEIQNHFWLNKINSISQDQIKLIFENYNPHLYEIPKINQQIDKIYDNFQFKIKKKSNQFQQKKCRIIKTKAIRKQKKLQKQEIQQIN